MARLNLENTPHKSKIRRNEHRGERKVSRPNSVSASVSPPTNSESESEREIPQTVKANRNGKGRRLIRGVRKSRQDDSEEGEDKHTDYSQDEEERSSRTSAIRNGNLVKRMGGGNELVSRFSDLSILPPQHGSERRKQRSLKSRREKDNALFQRQSKHDTRSFEKGTQHDTKEEDVSEDGNFSEDDEFDSLDEFIVGDDEIVSTYGDTDEDVEEDETEIIPKTPRRSPRKLFRGQRTPGNTLKSEDSVGLFSTNTASTVNNTTPSHRLSDESPGQQNGNDRKQSSQESDVEPQQSEPDRALSADKMEAFDSALSLPSFYSSSKPLEPAGFLTPPGSPSKPRLKSPSKTTKKIPPSPHKPSLDSFWDQGVTNDWNDKFSPRKTPMLGKLDFKIFEDDDDDDDDDSSTDLKPFNISPIRPPLTISSKNTKSSKQRLNAETAARREQAARKREFDQKKDELAINFLKELDDLVTNGEVQRLAESTGGVKITWNKKLATTAGRATWKKEVGRTKRTADSNCASLQHSQDSSARSSLSKTPDSQSSSGSGSGSTTPSSPSSKLASLSLSSITRPIRHHAAIELAEKIIDSEDRLLNTLAHEYCHLANFMISNVRDQPHGTSFKNWAAKCMTALASHSDYGSKVKITTKHSYVIDYKYCWGCQACGQEYGRHSKSIDPAKVRCGKCKAGKLLQIKPKPRNVKRDASKTVPRRRGLGEAAGGGI